MKRHGIKKILAGAMSCLMIGSLCAASIYGEKNQSGRTSIITSHFGMGDFLEKKTGDEAVYTLKDKVYMTDMVSSTSGGAARAGGEGGLIIYDDDIVGIKKAKIILDKESTSLIKGSGGLHQFEAGFKDLGRLTFLRKNEIDGIVGKELAMQWNVSDKKELFNISWTVDGVTKGPLRTVKVGLPYDSKDLSKKNKLYLYRLQEGGTKDIIEVSELRKIEQAGGDRYEVQGLVDASGTYGIGTYNQTISDSKGWSKESVDFVVARDLMELRDGKFRPKDKATRGEVALCLAKLSGEDLRSDSPIKFSDVAKGSKYEDAVVWAASKGIIKGYEDGTFRPDQPIKRQEIAALMYRYVNVIHKAYLPNVYSKKKFADDSKIASFAKEAVSEFRQAGILDGKGGNKFNPNDHVTREETAKMVRVLVSSIMTGMETFVSKN